jgi:WD40 repeat protein
MADSNPDATLSEVEAPVRASPLPRVDSDRYEVQGELGEGGLGRVIRAHDRKLNRPVAIKLLRKLSADHEQRFFREAQMTARLEHPSIVPVHDVGRWQTGEPFFAMKLVSGESLKEVVGRATTLATRLPLLGYTLAVCDAVAYAHSAGVIHRDLKPSNVMVGPFGETLVIDWGLAIACADDAGRAIVGTPHYMPPEQARGQRVDARSDVYALGALMYEVIAGKPPYAGVDSGGVILEIEVGPPVPLRELAPQVPEDLLAIVDKAMRRDPNERYADAGEVGADLRRYLSGQWVGAYRYSLWQRVKRRVARNKVAATVIAASAAALMLTGALSVSRIVQERDVAESRKTGLLYAQARLWMEKDPTAAFAWLKSYAAQRGATAVETSVIATDAVSRGVAAQLVRGRRAVNLGADGVTLTGAVGDTLVRWSATDAKAHELGPARGKVMATAVSEDGRFVLSAEGNALVQRPIDGGEAQVLFQAGQPLLALTVGKGVVAIGGEEGKVWVRAKDGAFEQATKRPAVIRSLVVSDDASKLLVVDVDYAFDLVALPSREMLKHSDASSGAAALSRDGSVLGWIDSTKQTIHVQRLPGGEERTFEKEHEGVINGLAFSSDGQAMATVGQDHTVVLRRLDTGERRVLGTHEGWGLRCVFSRDGKWLASIGTEHVTNLWNLETGDQLALKGHDASFKLLAFSADSQRLFTGDSEGEVRVWNVPQHLERVLRDVHASEYAEARYLSDGRIVSVGEDDAFDVWTPSTGAHATLHETSGGGLLRESKGWLVNVGSQVFVHRLDALDAPAALMASELKEIHQAEFDPGGTKLGLAMADHSIRLLSLTDGATTTVGSHDAQAWHVAFSPGGTWLASSGDDLPIRVWSLEGAAPRVLRGPEGLAYDLKVSPDGRWLVSAGVDSRIHVWSTPDFRYEPRAGHAGLVWQLAFSRDGKRLASASVDGTARIWPMEGGAPLILRNGSSLGRVKFGPGDATVVTAADDGSLSLWSASDGARLRVVRGHKGLPTDLSISPDGRMLATVGEDHTVREWPDFFSPPPLLGSPAALDAVTTVALVDDQPLSVR